MKFTLDQPVRYSTDLIDIVGKVTEFVRANPPPTSTPTSSGITSAQILRQQIEDLLHKWLTAASSAESATIGAQLTGHWLASDAIKFYELATNHLQRTQASSDPASFVIDSDIMTRIEWLAMATGDWSWAYRNASGYVAVTTAQKAADI